VSRFAITTTLAHLPGFYGKLPTLGDFVSRRLSRLFIEPWDAWLQGSLAASREQLGDEWLDIYLTSPIWRFALSPGVCGPGAWAGVLMPSVDRVGRYFPLTIASPVGDPDNLVHLFEYGGHWFEALEELALDALEDGFDLEAFDQSLQSLNLPVWSDPRGLSAGYDGGTGEKLALCVGMQDLGQMRSALVGLCGLSVSRLLPAHSIWGTGGSDQVGASLLICEGLPPIEGFGSMMTGRWQQRGWNMQFKFLPGWLGKFMGLEKSRVRKPEAAPPSVGMSVLRWRSSGISEVGNRRSINEDALLERPAMGLWMVADGMGGHSAGDVASQSILEALNTLETSADLEAMVERVKVCIEAVNGDLHRFASDSLDGQLVGSTVVVLLARNRECAAVWAGDSRLYRYRRGYLEQLTQDHSLLDELVRSGLMSPEQAAQQGNSNIITRAVGAEQELDLETLYFEAEAGDVFLLCSDGLIKELEPEDIAARLDLDGGEASAAALIEAALANGGRDNVTVIVVRADAEA
jgi:type VI secretion system protein ImpM